MRGVNVPNEEKHYSARSYSLGFAASILLTLVAYLSVVSHILSSAFLIGFIIIIAVIQLYVQLKFFLHLGSGANARWNIMIFIFMAITVGILVMGSLWIMNNLNYHMSPEQTDSYIRRDERIE
jgi:cytochrome o ubiquinol oxidase operon protein cyoD